MTLPVVAVTMGDPAGIGPEIVAKALGMVPVRKAARLLVYGDARVMERAAALAAAAGGPRLRVRAVAGPREAEFEGGTIEVVDLANADPDSLRPGAVSALAGRAAYEAIAAATRAAMAGEVDAVDTAPINKEALKAAGVPHIGHTEILEGLAAEAGAVGAVDPLTMFETGSLRVFFLTRHVALSAVPGLVTRERLLGYIPRCAAALRRLGLGEGELAVAGLNPHCGEHGLFGDEEEREIRPAVEEARRMGHRVSGPIGADSVFHQGRMGRWAAVLSLYHDQGHIACKTLDFERTVSLTLGLPFLRTSVDHGTAFDIAWQGRAGAAGMEESILAAARYAAAWRAGT